MSLKFDTNKDPFSLNIEIGNINLGLVNAIRRIILSEFPTIGFKTEDYVNSDLKVIENTSSMHNEYLLHRIGLVPIHYDTINKFDPEKYKFVLKMENNTNSTISVKSNNIKVINNNTGEEEDSNKFFPPDPDTKDFILLHKLKSNPNKIGEKIHIEGRASINIGSVNSRFSPVSCVAFSNKIHKEKKNKAMEDYLKQKLSKEELTNTKLVKSTELDFNLSMGERYFYTDDNNNPNVFLMYIESIGVIPSNIILYETLDIIKNKLQKFNDLVNNIINKSITDSDKITINKSKDTMEAYELVIQNENHTLGNLIQTYSTELFDKNMLNYIGYKNTHPLKSEIIIKIKSQNNTLEEINNIISTTCNKIIENINNLRKQIETNFKIRKVIKKK
jgi:DNA-directed RNA polymerase subunit L